MALACMDCRIETVYDACTATAVSARAYARQHAELDGHVAFVWGEGEALVYERLSSGAVYVTRERFHASQARG